MRGPRAAPPASAPATPRLPAAEALGELVRAAVQRRRVIDADTTALRWVHGEADSLPMLYVDRLGDVAFVRLRDPAWHEPRRLEALVRALAEAGVGSVRTVIDEPVKHEPRQLAAREAALQSRASALLAPPPEGRFVVRERGRSFSVSVHDGFSWGLFPDLREVRAALVARGEGRRVLNLFAYTCAFGVALADRNEVTNVDVSSRYLEIGAANYALNGLSTERAFVARDAFDYLDVALRKGNRWDLIILDPPAFSRGKAGRSTTFSVRADLRTLVARCLACLSAPGELLVATNYESWTPAEFRRLVAAEAASDGRAIGASWPNQVDFGGPTWPRAHPMNVLVGAKR